MKIRLYPTIEQAKTIDAWFLGLQKAYNMTLYALREGTPELRQKSANSNAEFPNWRYICSQSWLNYLRSKSPVVASVPANGLSSSVGGILNVDIRKAWESQGKLPIDSWFQATDAKGHPIVRWYSDRKPRRSCYLQINADKFQRQNDSVYITLRKDFQVKARGWNDKISFAEKSYISFFEKYRNSKVALSVRISKDTCGDYFAVITLKDVYRPVNVMSNRRSVGVDAGIKAMATDSDGQVYVNPRIKRQYEQKKAELGQQLARRYGPKNEQYRKDRKSARCFNTLHTDEIQEGIITPKEVCPSKRYIQAQTRLSQLERKVQRKRDMAQHIYTAKIISKANLVALEDLNVKAMMGDSNQADHASDAAMSELLRKLKYKANWSGGSYHAIGTFTASTQRCSCCGHTLQGISKLARGDSTFHCPVCGYVDDRDINAAKSILQIALTEISQGIPSADSVKKSKERKKRSFADKPIRKDCPNVFTHFSEEFVLQHKNPFIIIDESGHTLDDAQGYGYKDRQSAQKFWIHKMNS